METVSPIKPCDKTINVEDSSKPLSKNQKKKLEKLAKWQLSKAERRSKDKQKRKLKIQLARETGTQLGPSRKKLKANKMSASSCKLRVCFDLSLIDKMTTSERMKTFKQLNRCYSINRRAEAPLQMYFCGYSDKSKLDTITECFNWDINFDSLPYNEVFKPSEIIYLTSDSPNVLDSLDHDKVYVIGALVDHNRLKNLCFNMATAADIGHARLPLDKYFHFKTRKVLTIDQVYSIILQATEGKSWDEAILDIVPKRKGIEFKNDIDSGCSTDVQNLTNVKDQDNLSNVKDQDNLSNDHLSNIKDQDHLSNVKDQDHLSNVQIHNIDNDCNKC